MKRFKKFALAGTFAVAALFAFGAASNSAEAGGCGLGGYGVGYGHRAPIIDVYHAPIVHTCAYKVYFYDCGVLRCAGTFSNPYIAKRKALLLELNGYQAIVKKIIL
jgi:hypothetical protein